jgi:hypothetical protein
MPQPLRQSFSLRVLPHILYAQLPLPHLAMFSSGNVPAARLILVV